MAEAFKSAGNALDVLRQGTVKNYLRDAADHADSSPSAQVFFAVQRDASGLLSLTREVAVYEDLGLDPEGNEPPDKDLLILACARPGLEVPELEASEDDLARHLALNVTHSGLISLIAAWEEPHRVALSVLMMRCIAEPDVVQANTTLYASGHQPNLVPAAQQLFIP